jgi:hypothetical protein
MSTRRSRNLNTAAPDPGIPVTRKAIARLEAKTDRLASRLPAVQAEAQTRDVLGRRAGREVEVAAPDAVRRVRLVCVE